MPSLNQVTLIGNLTRDPEHKKLSSGRSVCNFGLALNDRYKNSEGKYVDKATFVDITVWGNLADVAAEFLTKGSLVNIVGKLNLETWETDGQKRSKLIVVADTMQFLDRKESRPADDKPATRQPRQPKPEDDIPF